MQEFDDIDETGSEESEIERQCERAEWRIETFMLAERIGQDA